MSGFTWYELMRTGPKAAAEFYSAVGGWGTRDASTPAMTYTLFTGSDIPWHDGASRRPAKPRSAVELDEPYPRG